MARAMRPVVILMLLATVLFVLDGLIDHDYAVQQFPGQSILDEYKGVGWTSFIFALANLLMTIAVARGSERTLLGRIALSGFFIVERPLTAFVLGPKPITSVSVHLATAVVELIILVGAVRVWRLGHSLELADVDAMFALDSAADRPDATLPVSAPVIPVAPAEPADARSGGRSAWLIGPLALVLAAVLVADGVIAGFLPGGKDWGTSGDSSGWVVYVYAAVVLVAASFGVRGGFVALRVLTVLALIFFVERAFSPFLVKVLDPVQLGLHGLAAFIALALALATASIIRGGGGRSASSRRASPAT